MMSQNPPKKSFNFEIFKQILIASELWFLKKKNIPLLLTTKTLVTAGQKPNCFSFKLQLIFCPKASTIFCWLFSSKSLLSLYLLFFRHQKWKSNVRFISHQRNCYKSSKAQLFTFYKVNLVGHRLYYIG